MEPISNGYKTADYNIIKWKTKDRKINKMTLSESSKNR